MQKHIETHRKLISKIKLCMFWQCKFASFSKATETLPKVIAKTCNFVLLQHAKHLFANDSKERKSKILSISICLGKTIGDYPKRFAKTCKPSLDTAACSV